MTTATQIQPLVQFKVSILGPSRVGKTSLLTALYNDMASGLSGTNVSVEPDSPTRSRLLTYKRQLDASLAAGMFDPGALPGSANRQEFHFDLHVIGAEQIRLQFSFQDFPGGWINRGDSQQEAQWAPVEKWIRESAVLLLPIDAAVLMEGSVHQVAQQKRGEFLEISQVEYIVRDWAKHRSQNGQSSMLILAPVKCETYFDDNGGTKDRSEELFRTVMSPFFYGQIVKTAQDEFRRAGKANILRVEYHPVDTIGRVELANVDWVPRFVAKYRVRRSGEPKGAAGLLASITKHNLQERAQVLQGELFMARELQKKRNIFQVLWDKIFSGDKKRQQQALEAAQKGLGLALDRIGAFRPTSRFKEI